jgi:6,7-dimethyl-8-ribityllumazine synthase
MARPPRILIVTSRYYAHIAAELEAGVIDAFKAAGAEWDIIEVPGAFEIPAAIAMSTAEEEYDGYVALGCVIRGETGHYDLICNEVARALMDLSLAGMAIGFGVLTVENEAQAKVRADRKQKNKGKEAATAVLRMVGLSYQFTEGGE